jgi:pantetheine-phosphate adenylyltransferase
MNRIALFPGTYDPFTLGHYDLVIRALRMFDKVVIAVGDNMQKNTMFTLEERLQYIRDCFVNEPNVEVVYYQGLTAEYWEIY